MVNIKRGVSLNGVQPEIVMAVLVVKGVYERFGYKHTVTSITDGKHSPGSLHYVGLAFDNRTWADDKGTQLTDGAKNDLVAAIQYELGPEWDVVPEPTHIHVELDLKGKGDKSWPKVM